MKTLEKVQARMNIKKKMELMATKCPTPVKDGLRKDGNTPHNEEILKIGKDDDGKRKKEDKRREEEGDKFSTSCLMIRLHRSITQRALRQK